MRRFGLAIFLMMCGGLAYIAAQSVSIESFDRSGLGARAQDPTGRELSRRISAHRRGDVNDAADIQRQLAAYYRSKGDYQRARMAEERANVSGSMPTTPYANHGATPAIPMPMYGGVQAPTPRKPQPTTYGTPVPSAPGESKPESGSLAIPVYQPENAENPAAKGTESLITEPAPPPAPAPNATANPVAPPPATDFAGRFFAMQGQTLHTWEFRPDGTFEHGWTTRGARTDAANFEAGTFRVAGPYVMLMVLRGSSGQPVRPRQLPMQMQGSGGRDGIVLNGIMLKPKL